MSKHWKSLEKYSFEMFTEEQEVNKVMEHLQ